MLGGFANGILVLFFILSMSMSIFFVTQLNTRFVSMRVRWGMEFIFATSFVYIILILTFHTVGFIFFIYMPIMISLVSTMNKSASKSLSIVTPMVLAFVLWFYRGWTVEHTIELLLSLWLIISVISWISGKITRLTWQIVFLTLAFMTVEIMELWFLLPRMTTINNVLLIVIAYTLFGLYIAGLAHYTKKNALFQEEVMYTDELTEIQNYRAFSEFLSGPARDENIIIMVVDIDQFKAINDLHGHVVGNEVLKLVVRTLRDVLNNQSHVKNQHIFRFGGDEIIVAMSMDSDSPMGETYLRTLFDVIRSTIQYHGQKIWHLNVTISAGVSDNRLYDHDLGKAFNAADQALYHVKKTHKNGIYFDKTT